MKVKEINIDEIVLAFQTCKNRAEVCRRFDCKQSESRFIKSLAKKANINPDDFFVPVHRIDREKKYYCECCGKEIVSVDAHKRKFCSRTCVAIYNNSIKTKRLGMGVKTRAIDFLGSNITEDEIIEQLPEIFSNREILNTKCKNCGKEIEYCPSSTGKFCSLKCQSEWRYKEYIRKWKEGSENGVRESGQISSYVKKYMLEKTNCSCEICGCNWVNPKSGKPIVEIHHKDGNAFNNKEENLQVLCPNHHAMTENYKNNNLLGRKKRKELINTDI